MLPFSGFALSIFILLMATMAFFKGISLFLNIIYLIIACIAKYKDRSLKFSHVFHMLFTNSVFFVFSYALLLIALNKDVHSVNAWLDVESLKTDVFAILKDFPNQVIFKEAITGNSIDLRTLFQFFPAIAVFLLPIILLALFGVFASNSLANAKKDFTEKFSEKVAEKVKVEVINGKL